MRLLVYVNNYSPDLAGGGAVYTDLFRTLAARGHQVTVRAPIPFYPEWRDKSGRNGLTIWRYVEEGVQVERFGLFIPRDPNSLPQRLLFEFSFFCSLLRGLMGGRTFDVIMAFSPLAGGVAAAGVMSAWAGIPMWLNVQDISADAAGAVGITRTGILASMLTFVERKLFNRAKVWSSISPVMIRRLEELRESGQPIHYLPNWVGLNLQRAIESLPAKIRHPGTPLQILYAGNIGGKQDLLEFCQYLSSTDVAFEMRVFGNGARSEELRAWISASGDPRFSMGNFLSELDFASALNAADLYLITETPGIGGAFIPSKLIPGLLSGTPILAVCDPGSPLGQEMLESGAGPVFGWNELHNIPESLNAALSDPLRLINWQEKARARAVMYDRIAIIDRFEEELLRMTSSS